MKFKVGDMVRYKDEDCEGIGKILVDDSERDGTLKVDTDEHGDLWFKVDEVFSLTDVEDIKEALKKVKEGWGKLVESINDVFTVDDDTEEDNQDKHMQVCERLNSIYVSKNKDYGNSFGRQYKRHGILSSVIRLDDKMNRLNEITKPDVIIEVEDETIEDTLLDLANYAIMTIMELEGRDE